MEVQKERWSADDRCHFWRIGVGWPNSERCFSLIGVGKRTPIQGISADCWSVKKNRFQVPKSTLRRAKCLSAACLNTNNTRSIVAKNLWWLVNITSTNAKDDSLTQPLSDGWAGYRVRLCLMNFLPWKLFVCNVANNKSFLFVFCDCKQIREGEWPKIPWIACFIGEKWLALSFFHTFGEFCWNFHYFFLPALASFCIVLHWTSQNTTKRNSKMTVKTPQKWSMSPQLGSAKLSNSLKHPKFW